MVSVDPIWSPGGTIMQAISTGYYIAATVFGIAADRLLIPLAVVVGLAGGAMIGAELAQLQAPAADVIH
jgi:hypothetical protein